MPKSDQDQTDIIDNELWDRQAKPWGTKQQTRRWSVPSRMEPHPHGVEWDAGRRASGEYVNGSWVRWPQSPDHQREVFEEFLNLSDSSPDTSDDPRIKRIERFALRWGPLGRCVHDERSVDCISCMLERPHVHGELGEWWFDSRNAFEFELHETWVEWASLARNLLLVTGKWRAGSSPLERKAAESALFQRVTDLQLVPRREAGVELHEQLAVTWTINGWLDVAVRFKVVFDEQSGYSLQEDAGPTVLGVLGLHLARMLERGANEWTCVGCGDSAPRKKAPYHGHSVYCKKKECQNIRGALQKRRSRERIRTQTLAKVGSDGDVESSAHIS